MSDTSANRQVVEQLAEEFIERRRRGEKATIDEYVERHPEHAEQIRDLFPALLIMEDVAPSVASVRQDDLTSAFREGGDEGLESAPALTHVGDYRILREVGRGGMGVVYEAEQESLGRQVALKVLPMHASKDAAALARFRREARAAARLHHTNIVPVYEVGQEGDICYYAMQFIQGHGLDEIFHELVRLRSGSQGPAATRDVLIQARTVAWTLHTDRFEKGTAMPSLAALDEPARPASVTRVAIPGSAGSGPDEIPAVAVQAASVTTPAPASGASSATGEPSSAQTNRRHYYRSVARIGKQTADALAFAHSRGIVHRDIKPSNLLLDAAGVVWVTDFGLAKTDDDGLTRTGDMLGTMRYMSPERFRGECDARADIYSLGLTLYELLVLRPAFESRDRLKLVEMVSKVDPASPRSIDPRIPRDLETIVLKAIEKDPRRRYVSAAEMAEDLRRFTQDEPILARRTTSTERVVRWARRNPALAALAALLVLAFATGFTAVTVEWRRSERLRVEAKRASDAADERRVEAERLRAESEQRRVEAEQLQILADTRRQEAEANLEKANQERQRAEDNFRMARDAVDEYLVRVGDSRLLNVSGLQPLRRELLESALSFYQRFVDQRGDDPTVQRDLADALIRIARITAEVGSPDDALAAYERALAIRTRLLATQGESRDVSLLSDVAKQHFDVGNLRLRLKQPTEAAASFVAAEGMWRELDVGKQQVMFELARSIFAQGHAARMQGNVNEALRLYNASLSLHSSIEQGSGDAENDPEFAGGVAEFEAAVQMSRFASFHVELGLFGELHTSLGVLPGVEDLFERSSTMLRKLIEDHPDHARTHEFQSELASNHERVGELREKQGRLGDALAAYTDALTIRRPLATRNPAVTEFQAGLAQTFARLGRVHAGLASDADTSTALTAAVERQRIVAEMTPGSPASATLAGFLVRLATVRERLGVTADALAGFREARVLLESIPAPSGDELYDLAVSRAAISTLAYAMPGSALDQPAAEQAADAQAAVDALTQAVEQGFLDIERLNAERALEPLRGRPDVQVLISRMQATLQSRTWNDDIEAAKAQAEKEGKDLFVYFSGSDWCNWCMVVKKGVFDKELFLREASKHFVLVQLDSPEFKPKPPYYARDNVLRGMWGVRTFPTMFVCDSHLRRFGDFSEERPAQVEEWLELLEQMRETRLLRDRKLADAKSAPNGQKAPHVREAFAGISDQYVIQDHRDLLRASLVDDPSLENDITTWYGGAFPRIWMELAQSYVEEQKHDLAQAAFERAVGVLKKQVLAGDIDVQTLAAAPRFEPLRTIESFQRLLAAGEAEISFPAAAGEVRRIQAHGREQEGVTAEGLAISHATNQLVTVGGDGLVKLWQLEPLAWERTLAGHSGPVYSVTFSPDGRRILAGGADGVIRLWDTGTGDQVHMLVGHLGAVRGVAFVSDGARAISCGSDGTVRVWDLRSAQVVESLAGHTGDVRAVVVNQAGTQALSGGQDGVIYLWDLTTLKQIRSFTVGEGVWSLAFSPDGQQAVAGTDSKFSWWYLDGDERRVDFSISPGPARCVAFDPDGTHGVIALDNGLIIIRQLEGVARGHRIIGWVGHKQLAFLPDGRRMLTAGADGAIREWLVSPEAKAARDLARAGDVDDAAAKYSEALATRPDDAALELEYGRFLGRWGRWDQASIVLAKAAELDPSLAQAWVHSGWWVVGPYSNTATGPLPPEIDPDPSRPVSGDAAAGEAVVGGEGVAAPEPPQLTWKAARLEPNGFLDIGKRFENKENISAYALTRVYSWQSRPVVLRVYSDDAIQLWHNGRVVHEHPWTYEAELVPLVLDPGWNTFLARVHNTSGAHGLSVVISDSPADLIRSYTQQERWEDAESVVAESANAHDAQPRLLNGRLLQARSRAALTISDSRKYREQALAEFEGLVAANPSNEAYAKELADALLTGATSWEILEPREVTSSGGATLTVLPDRSVLASETIPPNDTVTVVTDVGLEGVTALRLEALRDPSMTQHGPGRTGNFVLTGLDVTQAPPKSDEPDADADPAPWTWRGVFTRFTQQDWPIAGVLDQDDATGWAIWPQFARDHQAVFDVEPTSIPPGPGTLTIRLHFSHPIWKQHIIGRLRLAVSTDANAVDTARLREALSTSYLRGNTALAAARMWTGEIPSALGLLGDLEVLQPVQVHEILVAALAKWQMGDRAHARRLVSSVQLGSATPDAAAMFLAETASTRLLEETPDDVALLMLRAIVLVHAGRKAEAISDFENVVRVQPDHADAIQRLAQLKGGAIAAWNFDANEEGWLAQNECALSVADGKIVEESTGTNPVMGVDVSAQPGWKQVVVRAKFPEGATGRLFWSTTDNERPSDDRSLPFLLDAQEDGWARYRVFFNHTAALSSLWIESHFDAGARLEIDSIMLAALSDADLDRAVELSPEDIQLRIFRGDRRANFGRWSEAAGDFAEFLRVDPAEHWNWFRYAALLAYTNDVDKYREATREMMARFGTTQTAYIAERMAKASLLLPDSADRDQPMQMARFAVTAAAPGDVYLPYYKLALGMAEYRAGNYAEAIGLFEYCLAEEFKADGFRTSMAWCFLAMTQHAGGQREKARATIAEARAFMDQKLVSPSSSEIGPAWHDWLFAQIARREAEELLK